MKTVVAYKWARNPEDAAVRSDGTVDWRDARNVPGDDDWAAVALARRLGAAAGGPVVGLTVGERDASWALARGVDEAIAITDAPPLLDEAATAALLAAAIRRMGGVELVVIGDSGSCPGVAPALAGALDWSSVLAATDAAVANGRVEVSRRLDDRREVVSVRLPAVVAVAAASAEKQPPGMKEVLAARKRPVTTLSAAGLGFVPPDRLTSRGTRLPESAAARIFTGAPAAAARDLVAALRADGVL